MQIIEQIKALFLKLSKDDQKKTLDELQLKEVVIPDYEKTECPFCKSEKIIKYGKSKGHRRYMCKSCNRTFSALTGTFMHNIKKKEKMLKYGEILKEEGLISIEKIAEKVGVSTPTAFQWRHKILLTIPKKKEKFEGETQMDELWFLYSQKGRKGLKYSRKRGGSKRQGDNDFQVKLLTATDKKQIVMKVSRIGRISKQDIIQAVGDKFKTSEKLVTDGHNSYKSFAKEAKIEHISFIAKNHKAETGENVQYVNNLAGRLKTIINYVLRGVSTKYLQLYSNFFSYVEKNEFDILDTNMYKNTNIWDSFTNIEKMYENYIQKKSVRTYRCPTKKTWKSQNWNSDVIKEYSYI